MYKLHIISNTQCYCVISENPLTPNFEKQVLTDSCAQFVNRNH